MGLDGDVAGAHTAPRHRAPRCRLQPARGVADTSLEGNDMKQDIGACEAEVIECGEAPDWIRVAAALDAFDERLDGLAQRLRTAIEALEEAKAASVANAKDWPIAVDR